MHINKLKRFESAIKKDLGEHLKVVRLTIKSKAIKAEIATSIEASEKPAEYQNKIMAIGKRYTQRAISKQLSLHYNMLNRYENGKALIDIYTLVRLAIIYEKSLSELIPENVNNFDFDTIVDSSRVKN